MTVHGPKINSAALVTPNTMAGWVLREGRGETFH